MSKNVIKIKEDSIEVPWATNEITEKEFLDLHIFRKMGRKNLSIKKEKSK